MQMQKTSGLRVLAVDGWLAPSRPEDGILGWLLKQRRCVAILYMIS